MRIFLGWCRRVFISTHTCTFGSNLSLSCHLHGHPCVCGLFTLILPSYFLLYRPLLFLNLNCMKSMVNLHNSCNEGVEASDDLLLSTGSNSPDSARFWNVLGQSNGSPATGSLASHGPGSSDDNRNTRRRRDTFSGPEDEQARRAVLLGFLCEQYQKGITKRINNLWEESNMPAHSKPITIHCKAGSVSARLARNKSQVSGLCGPMSRRC